MFRPANSFHIYDLIAPTPAFKMTKVILSEDHPSPGVASSPIRGPVADIADPEEVGTRHDRPFLDGVLFTPVHRLPPFDLESQPITMTNRESIDLTRRPQQASSSPAVPRRKATGGQQGPNRARIQFKLSSARMTVLVVGVLAFIVVPGLVLGVVTKDMAVGIALSAAIATVASFLAALYHYKHSRD